MKAEINKEPEVFKPVEVTLTFETQKELDLFSKMIAADCRIPRFLEREQDIEEKDVQVLSSLMCTIHAGINP